MTLLESQPDDRIKIRLDFKKPYENTCDVVFTFRPDGDQTLVTWDMNGQKNFMSKMICMFMNMDKIVGGQFEQGLADIKKIAESKEPEPAVVPN